MIANFVTSLRIVFSLIMLHFSALSPEFYACYLLAGITDMVDGTVARKLGKESEFGEKFDTIADIVFVAATLYKLFPVFKVSMGIWIWIGIIAVIKVINVISGFVAKKRFVTIHSMSNKITGIVLFILPLTLSFVDIRYSSFFVCLFATFAALQEGYLMRTNVLKS